MEYSKTVPHTYIYNVLFVLKHKGVRHGRDRMGLDLQLPVQSLPITTNVVSLNPTYGVYKIKKGNYKCSKTDQ
jgi:hypothetical protein